MKADISNAPVVQYVDFARDGIYSARFHHHSLSKLMEGLHASEFRVISAEENAKVYTLEAPNRLYNFGQNLVGEGLIFIPGLDHFYITRSSPILAHPKAADPYYGHLKFVPGNGPFQEAFEKALEDSLAVPWNSLGSKGVVPGERVEGWVDKRDMEKERTGISIPAKELGNDEVTRYLLGESAENFGELLDDLGIEEYNVYFGTKAESDNQETAFARNLAFVPPRNVSFSTRLTLKERASLQGSAYFDDLSVVRGIAYEEDLSRDNQLVANRRTEPIVLAIDYNDSPKLRFETAMSGRPRAGKKIYVYSANNETFTELSGSVHLSPLNSLRRHGFEPISLEDLAMLRMLSKDFKENTGFTRESFVYVPGEDAFYITKHPICMEHAEERYCANRQLFSIRGKTRKQFEEILADTENCIAIPYDGKEVGKLVDSRRDSRSRIIIPSEAMGDIEVSRFLFGSHTDAYSAYLKDQGMKGIAIESENEESVNEVGRTFASPCYPLPIFDFEVGNGFSEIASQRYGEEPFEILGISNSIKQKTAYESKRNSASKHVLRNDFFGVIDRIATTLLMKPSNVGKVKLREINSLTKRLELDQT